MRDIITKLEELNVEQEQLNEGLADMAHEAEKDHEVQMARSDCYKSAKYAVAIHKMLKDVSEMEGIDGWVAAKITKAADYLGSVKHYMEGQAMSDVELAVVPVAGDMTDAMTMPQESTEEVYENKNSVKHIDQLLSLAPQRTPGDIIADIMHWAEANNMDIDDIVKQGKVFYNDDKLLFGDDVDEEVTEAEERTYIVVHAKHGKEEIKASSSYAAAKKYADMKKLKSTAGVDAHLADKEKTATESIEEAVVTENAERIIKVTNIDFAGPSPDKMQLPTSVTLRLNVPYDADEDDIDDMVADDLEDRYGVKVTGFETQFGESVEEDEDIIGDIISKLPKQSKAPGYTKSDSDRMSRLVKQVDRISQPSSPAKPGTGPKISAVTKQKQANAAAKMQTQSKFSEWSKK